MAEHDPVDALLVDARADLPSPTEVQRLRERLALPATTSVARGSRWRPIAGRLALTLGFCALAVIIAYGGPSSPPPTPVPSPPRVRPAATPPHVAPATVDAPERRLPPTPPVPTPAPPSLPSAPVAHARSSMSEVELIEQAQSALASGRLDAAQRALARHRTTFANGMLTEERRSLEIELDERRGDPLAAETALDAFRRDYPRSAHLPRLERLVATP